MKDIITYTNELINKGYGKTLIRSLLKAEGYKQLDIDNLDIPSRKSDEIDATEIMKTIINCEAKGMKRKEIEAVLAANELCKASTAGHILSLMKFVKAYHELMSK